ncbi:MAG: CRTAC1 family protein [Cyclobacteriaceae bacterium]|nr:CRTAC1 family protein [Cyclobacteriaceae bacterium]
MRPFLIIILPVVFIPWLSCCHAPKQEKAKGFKEVTRDSGIDFMYNFGDLTYQNILESSGSGISILDYNQDGFMDVYMLNGTFLEGISDGTGEHFRGSSNKLYHNNGDGTFREVSKHSGIDDRHWSMAATPCDYDGDGDTDLYLTNYGPNIFYENNGDGTFRDITRASGLQGPDSLNGHVKWSVGAAFWDYNGDKKLDVMVANFLAFDPTYVSPGAPDEMPHPAEYMGQASMLYQQMSSGGFKEVTREAGLYFPDSKCMGLTVFDYDGDGDHDLFQGNDHQANFLFRNDNTGVFQQVAGEAGVTVNDEGDPTGSMHGTVGDVDGDGLPDLLVTDLKYGALYRNTGKGIFTDITVKSGIAQYFSGKGEWAATFLDYDNDGDMDIFSANGTAHILEAQLPLLLENDGMGNFRNSGPELSEYFNEKHSGRGAAVLDYDNDGHLDIIVSHLDGEGVPVLLRNEGNSNHWLGIELQATKEDPTVIVGAKITLEMNDRTLVRYNIPGNAYLSHNDPRVHVGLGSQELVEKLSVQWGDGTIETFENLRADRYYKVIRGKGIE